MIKKSLLAALLATLAASAQAATVNGTFSAGLAGVTSSTFGITAGSVLSNVGGFVTSSTGDMSSITAFTPVTFSTVTATNGALVGFTSSFGSFIGTVDNLTTSLGPNAYVNFSALGNFTPAGTLSSFTAGPGFSTVSFTQTGALVAGRSQPAISDSFSFAFQESGSIPGGVPELAAWAMLLAGFGLTGVAMRRRGWRAVAS